MTMIQPAKNVKEPRPIKSSPDISVELPLLDPELTVL